MMSYRMNGSRMYLAESKNHDAHDMVISNHAHGRFDPTNNLSTMIDVLLDH